MAENEDKNKETDIYSYEPKRSMDKNRIILKLFAGALLYFSLINIILYIKGYIELIPEQWLISPWYFLITLEPIAIVMFLACIIVGWFIFDIE